MIGGVPAQKEVKKEDKNELDKQAIKENYAAIDLNPLGQRVFTHIA